ncbi:MAG: hypothetical protein CVV61_01850 [Tenericutes bacterium HGW-Tenericutes-6]|nr:MAG: hypothetical protein CVV61_01850 [Tenericutes bacterium HGW-Tenericutes-6]
MMLVSFVLNTLATIIHTVNRSFVELSLFYPTVSLFIRYGELLFLFGLIGLFLGVRKDKTIKWLSLLSALCIGFNFFMIEFSFFEPYAIISILLGIGHGLSLIGIMLKVCGKDCPLVAIKGYISLSILSIYMIHLFVYALIESYQSLTIASDFMIPVFYIMYQLTLFMYFKEWYREGFQYQNEVLYRM